jgi:hypothetical protein
MSATVLGDRVRIEPVVLSVTDCSPRMRTCTIVVAFPMAQASAVGPARPLQNSGRPSRTARTALALAIAEALELPLIRLQCHEGIDAPQALYDWDFPRQLLHLRTLEALADSNMDAETVEASLYTQRFLLARPLLRALRESPCVLDALLAN